MILASLAPVLDQAAAEIVWHERLWFYLSTRGQTNDTQFFFGILTLSVLLAAFAWRTWRLHRERHGSSETPGKWLRWGERLVSAALLVAALASTTQYFYAQRNNGVWLHRWDLYHQIIGAKYFSELGYFKIYECTWEVDEAHTGHFKKLKKMRNIETLAVRATEKVVGERDCESRFTPERYEAFATDVEAMVNLGGNPEHSTSKMSIRNWHKLFGDKGFNGTPFHAWILSQLTSNTEIVWSELIWLARFDVGIMFLAFGFVAWAWDVKTAALAALVFCSIFPNRFIHMGGSILRFDYIAMLIIALALMKKDHYGIAGVCVAWATAERVFPGVFALGLALKAGIELVLTRKVHRQYLIFGATAAATLLVLFCLSLTLSESLGAGVDSWADWWHNMKEHTRHTRGFRVGFKHMFMMDGNVTDKHHFVGWAKKTAFYATRSHYYYLTLLVLFAPLVLAARKLDAVTFTAIFCAAGFFCLTVATRYYYSMMVLFVLVDRDLFADRKQLLLTGLLVLGGVWLTKISVVTESVPFHYNTASSAAFAGYLVILGAMLWLDPWHRDRGLIPTLGSGELQSPPQPADATKTPEAPETPAASSDATEDD